MEERKAFNHKDVVPFAAMVTIESTNVAVNTLYKAATLNGMSYHVFLVYTHAIAALLLFLSSSWTFSHTHTRTRRSTVLPPFNFSIITRIGLIGLLGYTSQMMGFKGINYSSPTLASAISSLLPAFTFILALIFRMETLDLRSSKTSLAKLLGTIVSVSGAFVVTLFKGPRLTSLSTFSISFDHQHLRSSPRSNWAIGALFLTIECILLPMWYIILAQIVKLYPAELTVMLYYNLTVTILAAAVGYFAEPNSSAWRIRLDIGLVSILFAGILGQFLRNTVHAWTVHLKGPLFVTMFKPLSIAIAVVMGVLFLGDALYLGSVLGAAIISIGFYTVIWGKAKEDMDEDRDSNMESSAPLLQTN